MSSTIPSTNQTHLHLLLVLMTTAAVSAVFHLNPSIDMAFSQYFFDGSQFPLRHNGILQSLRQANFWVGGVIIVASMLLLMSARLRQMIGIKLAHALIPLITYGAGVGLIVNSGLKEIFGRARPRETLGLGGDHPLSAAWEFSQACASNCSFTSGEAAGAMAMMSVFYLSPARRSPTGICLTRAILQALVAIFAVMLSFNRILFGGHYLSDVVLSMLIIAAVMLTAELLMTQRWPFLVRQFGTTGLRSGARQTP